MYFGDSESLNFLNDFQKCFTNSTLGLYLTDQSFEYKNGNMVRWSLSSV